ncbi:Copper amine oxidase N-terminal domain-containing protein [Thermosyntropha lipolytica DSM 11003]|uniref:Copper amine oxidase N-terminal domain-containing protein n=1 Tax=Thermosyntropha lipolytica DSM 11003 TaxID=1123382 RepID=A0A1M5QKT2_9FIRM|nr:DUF5050 domain-containing protein [Thermosyntropha lipolytica]SHH14536.1 Copper amine oxidase N-terminal domain-containing protein [Thermosyntropha lipolytica DSM 11003]
MKRCFWSSKTIAVLITGIFLFSLFAMPAYAQQDIRIFINGEELVTSSSPQIIKGRVLLPFRAIFEALGAEVEWDNQHRQAIGKKGDIKIILPIDKQEAKVNDKTVKLDVPATIINKRTMVPVRFIAESLGEKVEWDQASLTVYIGKIPDFKEITSGDVQAEEKGNTSGNIINYGLAAREGDWIYYGSFEGIKRMKANDPQSSQVIIEGLFMMSYINVINNCIYYTGDGIYKANADGTGITKLSSDNAGNLMVAGDWVYYINQEDGKIYKMKTDGSSKIKLTDEECVGFAVDNGWIYYLVRPDTEDYIEGGFLYKVRVDGTQRQRLNTGDICKEINVADGWIYYINASDDKIYRIGIDGKNKAKFLDIPCMSINISGSTLYYSTGVRNAYVTYQWEKMKIGRINLDKTGNKIIAFMGEEDGDLLYNLNVAGDWIYYMQAFFGVEGGFNISRIKTDGSHKEVI